MEFSLLDTVLYHGKYVYRHDSHNWALRYQTANETQFDEVC
jgi:hypothetical protein